MGNVLFRRGYIVVFSGIDGVGKTTQVERMDALLRGEGLRTRRVWARGGYTPIFNTLKRLMRAIGRESLPPPGRTEQRAEMLRAGWRRRVWLTIAIVDLALYYALWVRGLKWANFIVLSDRYLLDTEVDFELNFPGWRVSHGMLWRMLCWLSPVPDAAFIFTVPVDESIARSRDKNEPFPDSAEVLVARWGRYDAECLSGSYVRIDGTRPRDEIMEELIEAIRAARAR